MVLDAALLNTQDYKAKIKGKVEQSRERGSALPYTEVFGMTQPMIENRSPIPLANTLLIRPMTQ